MWGTLVVFSLSAAFVVLAGWELTRRAEKLAEHTGLGHAWIGAILLAGATSLPELSVDLIAVRSGAANFATGDLFGSCMFNMLVLAVADLLTPQVRILTRVIIDQAMAGVLAIIVLALAALGIVTASQLAPFGVGWATVLIGLAYLWGAWLLHATRRARVLPVPVGATPGQMRFGLWQDAARFAAATLVLVLAARLLIGAATELVEQTGVTTGFFGIIVLAVVTSLPEIVVSIAGIRAGSYDLVVGNLLGSNAFNMVILFILDVVDGGGPLLAHAEPSVLVGNLFAVVLTALVVLGTLSQAEPRHRLLDPGALPVVLAYGLGLAISYRMM
uniref:Sodium/calcium exchanger membrane region domain-containing protein n=1 Tax=Thermomicrobium roseum TaxID=500 RepID=A0A7C2BGQ4_THERO